MPKFRVTVQYPYIRYYEKTVEVEALTEHHARPEAIRVADEGGWDDACEVGDGVCGATETTAVELVEETPAEPPKVSPYFRGLLDIVERLDAVENDERSVLDDTQSLIDLSDSRDDIKALALAWDDPAALRARLAELDR